VKDVRGNQGKPEGDSLECTQPGVRYEGPQYRREVAEAAEGVVDGGGQVLIPVQVLDKVECQHRCYGHRHRQERGQTGTRSKLRTVLHEVFPIERYNTIQL